MKTTTPATTEPDAGMWEAEIDHEDARYRVAVVRDWIGPPGEPPFPCFEWSNWIKTGVDDSALLEKRAASAAASVILEMRREARRFQPIRLSGRVEV